MILEMVRMWKNSVDVGTRRAARSDAGVLPHDDYMNRPRVPRRL
jgi:hypothetical protein